MKNQYHLRAFCKSVDIHIADHVAAVAKECMEGTFAEIFPEVPFVVVPEIRDSWG